MGLRDEKPKKRGARLIEGGKKIEIRCDNSTVVVRKVRDSDAIDYPDLVQAKTEPTDTKEVKRAARRGRKSASAKTEPTDTVEGAADGNESQGDAEPGDQ